MIRDWILKSFAVMAVCVSTGCAVHVQRAGQTATEARATGAVLDSTAAGWNRGELATYMAAYVDTATAMGSKGVDHGVGAIEAGMRAGFWKSGRPLKTLHYSS